MLESVGITGYGVYIPANRLRVAEVAGVWGKDSRDIQKSLGVSEKAVPGIDEDAVTMAVEASLNALKMAGASPSALEAVFVGSESHPYAVNPSATIIAEALGVGKNYFAVDLEFACKAGTAGMVNLTGLLEAKLVNGGLVVGSDASQSKPHDALEYTAGAAAAAFILGRKKQSFVARILDFASFSSDTPDFWRRDGTAYPSHQGRFTGKPAYFAHVIGAAKKLLEKTKLKPKDFDYCVFHMPNGRFPVDVALSLGFDKKQLGPPLVVDQIGNPYSASSLLGLCQILDIAKPNQTIFLTSYGSGAGADSFVFKTTRLLTAARKRVSGVKNYLDNKNYISYLEYLKFTGKI